MSNLYLGTGNPWAGQRRFTVELAFPNMFLVWSSRNFGKDPPIGSEERKKL